MRPVRVGLVVVGVLVVLVGFGLATGGGALLAAHAFARDAHGYYTAPTERFATDTAVLTAQADLGGPPGEHDWLPIEHVGTLRLRVTGPEGRALFVGIAPTSAVDGWLDGVAHEQVTDVDYAPFRSKQERVPGRLTATPPADQPFWVASDEGIGTRTARWDIESGDWSLVVMNADGTPGVSARVQVGAKSGLLCPIGVGLAVAGLVALIGGALVLVAAMKEPFEARRPAPTAPVTGAVPAGAEPPYPVRLDARLDAPLSRWLWLVKWLLVLPHVVVLAFLWVATCVLTFVAGVSILFTERYPRGIFDFNVGVMRWTWRVGYYAFSALGTDRYPSFSLHADASYPADFAVDYPEHLSRGLVLVKWWLLAIPHYLIVGLFAGGWGLAGRGDRPDGGLAGAGLIGIVVLVAMVMLLFTTRYPKGLFDFVLGMNRWCYRVLAYAALLRDEYPPFRFDSGGTDPGTAATSTPPPAPPEPPSPAGDRPLVGSST